MSVSGVKRRGGIAVLVTALVVMLTACGGGQRPEPTSIPLRPTATAAFPTGDIEKLMTQLLDAGAPAVIVEVRDGAESWSHAVGVAAVNTQAPATPDLAVRVASLTKPMVAAIVLQLVDEGRLSLDEDATTLIPGQLAPPGPVTIRELLNHTSGAPDYVDALSLSDPITIPALLTTPVSNAELMAKARTLTWTSAPGSGFTYSNTNYVALSMIIEQVTGRSLGEELQTRIAEPLGLAHTLIPEGTSMPDPHADGYVSLDSGLAIDVTAQQSSLWSGAGGVVSTVDDVTTFMRALLRGQVVAPALLGEMLRLGDDGYGLGIQAREDRCERSEPATLALAPAGPTASPSGSPSAIATDEDRAAVPSLVDPDATATSGSVMQQNGQEVVQIGDRGYVYGHLGSGLGYRALTMSSPDGLRQVTISWTASPTDYSADPRLALVYQLMDAALMATCR